MISARPTRLLPRSMTIAALSVLTILPVMGCAEQSVSAPSTTVSTESVSPACLKALRDEFDGALYQPSAEAERLPECASESEEAIGEAAEHILREASESSSPSPSSSR